MIRLKIITILLFLCSSHSFANIVGTDLQNFNPTSNGLDFVTVHSSDTLDSGILNFGAFLSYATNSLPYYQFASAPTNQKFTEPNDSLIASDLHLALGITKGWDIGASAALIASQDIEQSDFLGTYNKKGLIDTRINTKIRFYNTESSGAAFLASVDFEQTQNNPFSGTDPGPTINLGIAWDTQLTENWRLGVNGGYRLKSKGQAIASTQISPVEDQLTYSAALNYDLRKWDSHLMFELFGSTPTDDSSTPTDRKISNLQGLVGWRWDVHKRFDVHAGVGTEVYHGLATPDLLAYLGFNMRLGALWKKSKDSDDDGVPDVDDRCPQTPPSERNDVNGEGCADSDEDGVYNNVDQCPETLPKDRDQVNEQGCADNDKDGVPNSIDQCPETLPENRDRVNSQGCVENQDPVDGDDDNDGVPNSEDQCPDTAPGVEVNDLGCDIARVKDITLDNVNFYTGTAKVTKSSKERLDEAKQTLAEIKDTIEKVIVEGHTDSVGKESMNKKLSQYRANTIRKYLIRKVGLSSEQVEAKGYGESKPVANNKTKSGRLKNRRVELRIIRTK